MSAEVLRRAAALMRERAEAATKPPWGYWRMEVDGRLEVFVPNGTMDAETVLEFKDYMDCEECVRPSAADADQIASWHPAVALAVADWIESTADRIEIFGYEPGDRMAPHYLDAYTVARAYLGSHIICPDCRCAHDPEPCRRQAADCDCCRAIGARP